ncbi:hypothetical protein [Spartinivicinus ruber]|nr:hypothetical protein [Spartinivicinus ruber]
MLRWFFGIQKVEVSFVPSATVTHALLEIDKAFTEDQYKSVSWEDRLHN